MPPKQNPMAAMNADKSSHMSELLNAWGVQFDPNQVVADRGHALSVTLRQGEEPVVHLGVLGLDKQSFAADDVISESAIEFEHEVEDTEEVVEKFKDFLDQVTPEDFASDE